MEIDPVSMNLNPKQMSGREAVTTQQAAAIRQLSQQSIEGISIVDADPITTIDNKMRADVLQKVMESKWAAAHGDQYSQENEFYSNLFGHCPLWFEIDDRDWSLSLDNIHVKNCLPDPTKTFVDKFEYLVVAEPISSIRAKINWPNLKEDIDRAAQTSRLGNPGGEWELGRASTDTKFERGMLTVLTAYVRNQPFPMTEQEALDAGGVSQAMDFANAPIDGVFKLKDGSLVSPENDNWPTTSGIRIIKIIDQIDTVIMDQRSPYPDINVGWNKNLPIPYSPYGLGESVRLKDLTDAINLVGSNLINSLNYYRFPAEYWPKSLLSEIQETEEDPHTHPGVQFGIEDADFIEWFKTGKLQGFAVQPPPIPSSVVDL
jgi:hypothetical protein